MEGSDVLRWLGEDVNGRCWPGNASFTVGYGKTCLFPDGTIKEWQEDDTNTTDDQNAPWLSPPGGKWVLVNTVTEGHTVFIKGGIVADGCFSKKMINGRFWGC
jgi:hypothetical protein